MQLRLGEYRSIKSRRWLLLRETLLKQFVMFCTGGYGQGNASAGFNASSQGYGSQAGGFGGQGNYSLTSSQGYGAGDTYGTGAAGGGSNYAGSDYGEAISLS